MEFKYLSDGFYSMSPKQVEHSLIKRSIRKTLAEAAGGQAGKVLDMPEAQALTAYGFDTEVVAPAAYAICEKGAMAIAASLEERKPDFDEKQIQMADEVIESIGAGLAFGGLGAALANCMPEDFELPDIQFPR